jgi:thiosulfate dehydrogenase [quinone] large subunit
MSTPNSTSIMNGQTLAFLVLRGWLGIRALVAGVDKYSESVKVQKPLMDPLTGMQDPSGALVDVVQKVYGLGRYHAVPQILQDKFALEPLLPSVLLKPFYAVLGPALIILGVTLLLGIFTRISLFLQGILYIVLTIGLMLINQNDGATFLGIHIVLVAMALVLVDNNRFALLKKW